MVNTIAFYFLCYNNKYEVENDERKLFMGWCFGFAGGARVRIILMVRD